MDSNTLQDSSRADPENGPGRIPEGYQVVVGPGGEKYLVPRHFVPDVKLKLAMQETTEVMHVQANKSEVRRNFAL